MVMMQDLAHIFRAYDIRGDAQSELTPQIGYQIAVGLGQHFKHYNCQHIVLAYDGRISSPDLSQAVITGLLKSNLFITNVGCGPTPYLYFCDHHLRSDAAIMITGSHNPGHINGLKIVMRHQPFWGEQIQDLFHQLTAYTKSSSNWQNDRADCDNLDLRQTYIDYLCQDYQQHYPTHSNLKIVWDPGNGATGEVVTQLIKQLPGQHTLINGTIDGNFPNHHPDPTQPENLQQLIHTVKNSSSDIGIAFDGDGDRIGVVTAQGQILYGEHLLELLVPEVLAQQPGATIIADVKTTQHFATVVKHWGGRPLLWKTGHSAIKAKMRELQAPFAAEMSGHIFFADRYLGYDDGVYTALRVIGLLNKTHLNLDGWLSQRPKFYTTPELRIDCQQKFEIVEQVKSVITKGQSHVMVIDGIRVDEEHGWWVMRASNTQELIVVRAESSSQEYLKSYLDRIVKLLSPYEIDLKDITAYQYAMPKIS